MRSLLLIALSLACLASPLEAAKQRPQDKEILSSQTFINQHPDLMHRLRGLEAYQKQRYSEAFTHFKRAAKFADKPSQGMVAEMLWKGEGVAMNRPLAYAWMELAAERLYPTMLAHREKYWETMNEAERAQALAQGQPVYDVYGDDVAKKRLSVVLRRAKNNITGSRVGFVGFLKICLDGLACLQSVDGSEYYQDKFWKPEQYFKWQDEAWKNPPSGKVDIGPLEVNPEPAKKK